MKQYLKTLNRKKKSFKFKELAQCHLLINNRAEIQPSCRLGWGKSFNHRDSIEFHRFLMAQECQDKQPDEGWIPVCVPLAYPVHWPKPAYNTLKRCPFLICRKVLWEPSCVSWELCLLGGVNCFNFHKGTKATYGLEVAHNPLHFKNILYLGIHGSALANSTKKLYPNWQQAGTGYGIYSEFIYNRLWGWKFPAFGYKW